MAGNFLQPIKLIYSFGIQDFNSFVWMKNDELSSWISFWIGFVACVKNLAQRTGGKKFLMLIWSLLYCHQELRAENQPISTIPADIYADSGLRCFSQLFLSHSLQSFDQWDLNRYWKFMKTISGFNSTFSYMARYSIYKTLRAWIFYIRTTMDGDNVFATQPFFTNRYFSNLVKKHLTIFGSGDPLVLSST